MPASDGNSRPASHSIRSASCGLVADIKRSFLFGQLKALKRDARRPFDHLAVNIERSAMTWTCKTITSVAHITSGMGTTEVERVNVTGRCGEDNSIDASNFYNAWERSGYFE